jgi:hypothetical protein
MRNSGGMLLVRSRGNDMISGIKNRAKLALLFGLLLSLDGCGSVLTQSTSDAAGVAGAGIASAVTHNGSIAAAIGLGVQSVASSGLGFVERRVHHREQDQIAEAAGPLPVGGIAAWHVVHIIPIEADQHGEVSVSQAFGGNLFACKEIVFSVNHKRKIKGIISLHQHFYVTTICEDNGKWHWAEAEPATSRWGALQ